MDNKNNEVLAWDDPISEESEYILLPEGDYDFTVKKFDRGRFNGSDKLPACNKAILTIEVNDGKGNTGTITHTLLLVKKLEFKLSEFFIAIGQKKHGETLTMNWNKVVGAKGRCKVYIDTWKNDRGIDAQSNKIKKFYEPDPAQTASPFGGGFTPGKF